MHRILFVLLLTGCSQSQPTFTVDDLATPKVRYVEDNRFSSVVECEEYFRYVGGKIVECTPKGDGTMHAKIVGDVPQ